MRSEEIRLIENLAAQASQFDVRWHMTSRCNYACAFCIQGDREAHNRDAAGENATTRKAIADALTKRISSLRGYDTVRIGLIGGEISILPDLPALLDLLSGCGFNGRISFQITTNLSMPAEFYRGLYEIIIKNSRRGVRRSLHLCASFYAAYTNEEQFCRKLLAIVHLGHHAKWLFPRIMVHGGILRNGNSLAAGIPILSDKDYRMYERLRNRLAPEGIQTAPIVIRSYETAVSRDTMDRLESDSTARMTIRAEDITGKSVWYANIQTLGKALEGRDSFCPTGYVCDAGIHTLWVNAFGDTYRCPALGSSMRLGSLLDGSCRLLNTPTVCTADHCSCSQFSRIEKPAAIEKGETDSPNA